MQISTIGIDIGKNSFHFVGFDARGGIVIRRQCSPTQLVRALANVPPCLVGMEACCGAHHLGRILIAQGHDVRLIPPQYVKPFVKSHKNDLLDAEAIGEAVQRPTMRFVPLKTMAQLDLQAIHRLRTRLVGRRTAVINQMRGFLLERGVTCPIGREALVKRFPEVLDNPTLGLSVRFCRLLKQLRDEWRLLDDNWYTLVEERIFKPLELHHSVVQPADALLHRATVGHFLNKDGANTRTSFAFLNPSFAPAGATAMLTAKDLATFALAHVNDGVGTNGYRLFSAASARRMRRQTAVWRGIPGGGVGLGWWTFDKGI